MKSNYLETLEKLQKALTMFDMSFSVSNKVFRLAIVAEILDTVCLFEQLYNSWSEHLPFGEGPDDDVDFAYWKKYSTWETLLNSAQQNACIDDYPVDMGNGIKSDMIHTNRRKNFLKSIGYVLRRSKFSGKEAASNFVKVINLDKTHMMTFGNMVFDAISSLILILSKIDSLLENPDKSLLSNYFERQKARFDDICDQKKSRIQEIINDNLSSRRKCNKLNALRDELWDNLKKSKFLDALKEGINTYDINDYHKDHPDIEKSDEEIREMLAFEELVNKNLIPDKEKTGQYIYKLRKEISFNDISTFYAYLYAIPIIRSKIEWLNTEEQKTEVGEDGAAGGEETNYDSSCFKFPNDFTRERVAVVVKEFYHGSAANLALIETVLYDHGQLKKRNAHTAFLKALMAWGVIEKVDDEGLKKVSNGMAAKMKSLPPEGYLGWKDKGCVNDRGLCIDIGKRLGESMRYER